MEENVESSIQQSDDIVCEEISGSNNESTNPKSKPACVNKVPFIRDLVEENIVKLEHVAIEEQVTMSNSDNIVDAIVQPFVVVNDHVAPSHKSIYDFVVELVTFSIKENITTLDVAQDVGTSSV
ncbi:hypothetical protein L195_g052127, partial [Trifolium pratense]